MKRCLIIVLLAFVLYPPDINSQVADSTRTAQVKIALVIGNGNYTSSVLANPENDAGAISEILQKLGFIVLSYKNLEQKEMKIAIDDFGSKLKNADVALFFYAGHGVQSRNYNYLIPVDATLQSEAQIEYDCVQADRVLALMDDFGAKIKIMILDACRNNPFERSWSRATAGNGLALMKASNNTFIAYATAPGSTASDGSGNNSLYTSAILESITIPDFTIDQMFQNVGRIVSQKSNEKQIPWKSSSLTRDFYFNRELSGSTGLDGIDYNIDFRDNQNYKTVRIGTQVWMQKNLNITTFNNGDSIPEIKDPADWNSTTISATCIYNNRPLNAAKYGRLYNFYAASDVRNLCPAGWHVPTNNDWEILITELGGSLVAGGKMKEAGTVNWVSPNTAATNRSGFSAQPFGLRKEGLDYDSIGLYAGFYSVDGIVKTLTSSSASIGGESTSLYTTGHSIRCIKGRNPLAETDSASGISGSSATLNGKVNPNLAFTIISFEYGTSTSYGLSITADQSPAQGSVPVIISGSIAKLTPGTTYHYRTKAESVAGVTYGADQTMTTLVPPDAATNAATSVTAPTALLNGSVNANNAQTTVSFEYGTTTAYGQTENASPAKVSGNVTTSVSADIAGLTEKTLYHFRVKAESFAGIIYGNDLTFTTLPLPVTSSVEPAAIASTSATLRGTVNPFNLSAYPIFEYGITPDYGQSIKAVESPVTGNSEIPVSISVTNLTAGSTYHFRVKATSQAGATYSDDVTFNTPDILKDLTGNTYNTVYIGDQEWMAENLRTTKFNDGTDIPQVIAAKPWSKLKTPAYCWFNNDTSSGTVADGALYNWYTVNSFKLCPTGWHVPSNAEWDVLTDYLGGSSQAGGKLKEAGTNHWQKPGTGATNESGFTALPGGSRDLTGSFVYYGLKGQWWSSDDTISNNAWFRGLDFSNNSLTSFYLNKSQGFSVRCLKEKVKVVLMSDSTAAAGMGYFIDSRDQKQYKTVKIGNQVWMAENLKTTKFSDDTDIPQVIDKIAWTRLETPAYCWYENQEAYNSYGALYNWYTVNSGKLCPNGWHIPSDEEWNTLLNNSGGTSIAGGYLKETGLMHWAKPNTAYPFDNPFKALPGGLRDENGEYLDIGRNGYWWSSSINNKTLGWYRLMSFSNTAVNNRNFKNKPIGLSVRCIMD